ncbi:hypothetical protein RRG08_037171 [Elysia crispata]|uniref:Uncharacterized protein n=1 Tax=Elysia crispata TaxID=231223 RepID=A0AAE1DA70_9GAST|nr:hypothetical protein RRG08_037171 [Elysia crispata]
MRLGLADDICQQSLPFVKCIPLRPVISESPIDLSYQYFSYTCHIGVSYRSVMPVFLLDLSYRSFLQICHVSIPLRPVISEFPTDLSCQYSS